MVSSLFESVVENMTSEGTYYTGPLSADNIQQAMWHCFVEQNQALSYLCQARSKQCWVCASFISRSAQAAAQLVFIMSQGMKKTTFGEPGCEGLYKNVNE